MWRERKRFWKSAERESSRRKRLTSRSNRRGRSGSWLAKAELTLVREPTAADIIALFEQLAGRPAAAQERKDVEAEMAVVPWSSS
jgi:hypothetical protein